MRVFDRLRDWFLGSVLHEVANHKVATARAIEDATNHLSRQIQAPNRPRDMELKSLIDSIKSLNSTFSTCEGSNLETILQIIRAEPAMAFKKWLDESIDRDKATQKRYEDREKELLRRWADHTAALESRIALLEGRVLSPVDQIKKNKLSRLLGK